MGLLLTLLAFPFLGPVRSTAWIAARVAEEAEHQLYDPERTRQELEVLELRRDLGEIDEAEYAAAEDQLLGRLAAIREREAEGR